MPAPSTAITRFDLSIGYSEFSLLANQKKYIGLSVLPPIGVAQEASDFRKMKIASLLTKIEDTVRAQGGEYSRDDWEWTKDSYAVEEHGVEELVDDAQVERYGDIIRAEQMGMIRALNRILQRLEYDIAAAVFNTTTWTGSSLATTVGVPWTTASTADPIADIDAAHDKVITNCGSEANTLVVTRKGLRAMLRTSRLESLLKYDMAEVLVDLNNAQNSSRLSDVMGGLCQALQVQQILVARGMKNTANKGLTPSLSRLWDDTMAMLCVTASDGMMGDLESPSPCIGRTVFSQKNGEPLPGLDDAGMGSLIIDEYREERVRGSVIRPRNKRQVKILHPECGHLLQAVTA